MVKWIKVGDKLPKLYKEVVFFEPYSTSDNSVMGIPITEQKLYGQKHIGFYDSEWWRTDNGETVIDAVSHWIELPDIED